MNTEFQKLIPTGLLLVCTFIGCTQAKTADSAKLSPQQENQVQQASPQLRLTDHKAWINRLLATPPVEHVQQTAAAPETTMTLPVPTPQSFASDGQAYFLQIDTQAQLAWLTTNGGIGGQLLERHGPWKLDNPDVTHLVQSLRPPPPPATQ